MHAITIQILSWKEAEAKLKYIRTQVFMLEQGVSADQEWDGLDQDAIHLLLRNEKNQAIGCARILNHDHIGRMAVLKQWRHQGCGKALMKAAIAYCCEQQTKVIHLSAQVDAINFYQKLGFEICSNVYMDANIPHQDMRFIC